MSEVENGWDDNGYRQANFINSNWFGFSVINWGNGNLSYIGLIINDERFGWYEEYDGDGTIDYEYGGFYLNDRRI